jgi:hypothetical protein
MDLRRFYYVREARNPATVEKYAHDITVDRRDRFLMSSVTAYDVANRGEATRAREPEIAAIRR